MKTKSVLLTIAPFCLLLFVTYSAGQTGTANKQTGSASGAAQYVGLKHGPNLPRGLKDHGGGLITDPYKDTTQFGLAHVTRGTTNMVWFELMTHHDAEGKAYWEVLDAVTTPPLRRNQLLMLTLCNLNDKFDPEIAAVVQPVGRGSYETRVLKAWRANRQTRKLEVIPVRGVRCNMQGDD